MAKKAKKKKKAESALPVEIIGKSNFMDAILGSIDEDLRKDLVDKIKDSIKKTVRDIAKSKFHVEALEKKLEAQINTLKEDLKGDEKSMHDVLSKLESDEHLHGNYSLHSSKFKSG